jgi:hypothetical protein
MAGFDEERVRAASLAAVSLAAMRSKLRQFAEWEELRFPYERAVDAVLPILNSSDPDVVARYGAPLEAYFGPAVQPALVESLVDSLLQPDPIAAAVALAEQELHLSVERRDNVIEIDTYLAGDPRRTLLAVVSLCEGAAVAVTTMPWNGPRAYAVWRPPELVLVIPRTGGVRGAHHVLRGFGPGAFKDDIESLPEPRHRWFSEEEAPDEVKELVKVSGL